MSMLLQEPRRSLHQIVKPGDKAVPAYHTEPVWVWGEGVFSKPTGGNTIKHFTTGKDYFADLIAALAGEAQSSVYIAGWQVNWDALMAKGVRLYDIVYEAARRGVSFYVMPWDDANPLQTYETQTQVVLESINARLKDEKRSGAGKVMVRPAATQSDRNAAYFSHHQKQVVIDGRIAYAGGIDLAYGRFDDDHFDLNPRAKGRNHLNSYNPGVPPLQPIKEKDVVDPDLMLGVGDRLGGNAAEMRRRIANGQGQVRYLPNSPLNNSPTAEGNEKDLHTLRADQPRMPWQDVHCRIEGPAAVHLTRNFVKRWNSQNGGPSKLPLPQAPTDSRPLEGASIQVLRSAPSDLVKAERVATGEKTSRNDGVESDIHRAMMQLIEKAKRFIYLESQFFVSAFGQPSVRQDARLTGAAKVIQESSEMGDATLWGMRKYDDDEGPALEGGPRNAICEALIKRIQKAILDIDKPKFHVYITLPVHPEGSLLDATVAVQVHWTMQSLCFGTHSLLNGIRRAVRAVQLREAKDENWAAPLTADEPPRSVGGRRVVPDYPGAGGGVGRA